MGSSQRRKSPQINKEVRGYPGHCTGEMHYWVRGIKMAASTEPLHILHWYRGKSTNKKHTNPEIRNLGEHIWANLQLSSVSQHFFTKPCLPPHQPDPAHHHDPWNGVLMLISDTSPSLCLHATLPWTTTVVSTGLPVLHSSNPLPYPAGKVTFVTHKLICTTTLLTSHPD